MELRKLLYATDNIGNTLYGMKDLSLVNGIEANNVRKLERKREKLQNKIAARKLKENPDMTEDELQAFFNELYSIDSLFTCTNVDTLISIDDGIEYWDLTTSDNFPVSFGIYIFHVKSEHGNETVGRFALIK